MERQKRLTLIAFGMVLAGIVLRLLPHPENFTPVMAIALFAGVTLPPVLSLTVPLIIMIATDLLIGPHDLAAFVWGSFLLAALIGVWARRRPGFGRVFTGALAGSAVFFLITNLGVFFFGGLYPLSRQGLAECFVMAIPFFRNSLAGDLFFTGAFFGLYALASSGPRWTKTPKESF